MNSGLLGLTGAAALGSSLLTAARKVLTCGGRSVQGLGLRTLEGKGLRRPPWWDLPCQPQPGGVLYTKGKGS